MVTLLAQAFSLLILTLQLHLFSGEARTLFITNNCNYTVWPVISSTSGSVSANDSGFTVLEGESRVVVVQTTWSGQVWGRTLCSTDKSTGSFSCQTGDCNTGKIQCTGLNGKSPVTSAEFALGRFDQLDFYDVSVVNGYNLPLMLAPHVESGDTCVITGCVFDLKESCSLAELQVLSKTPNDSTIIGCRNPCQVFDTDEYCCKNATDCQRSDFSLSSLIFKKPCPRAYSFARDEVTDTFTCNGSRASSYNITFCPSPTLSRLFSVPFAQGSLAPAPAPAPSKVLSPVPLIPPNNSTTKPVHQNSSSITGGRKWRKSVMVTFPTVIGVLVMVLLGIYILKCYCKRPAKEKSNVQTDEMRRFADSLQFDFSTIRLATCDFAAENKLGEGGFGEVYKGKLDGGEEIAVKRLSKNSGQGISEFETEIVLVAKLQHKNLVKLLGYCAAPMESLLVYEFLCNSSLDRFLFDPTKKSSLDWQTRFRIIIGIARGLVYLHEDSRIKVVHRDLKSSNILLDEAMNPKIADFGLARLFGVDQTQGDTKKIAGTFGYMAPEYALAGHYSAKSDVYSFGVIVLETISGQRNRLFGRLQLDEALLHRAWRLWNADEALKLVDIELGDNVKKEEVLICIQIGLLCIQENAVDRPRMASIVAALNGQAISLPTPKPPHFFGCAADGEARENLDGIAASHMYSGSEAITNVYSRD